MAYYSAHYGNWNEPGAFHRVDFGGGCCKTHNYRTAIEAAQKAANESGQIVHFCKEYPTGKGLTSEWRELYPVI